MMGQQMKLNWWLTCLIHLSMMAAYAAPSSQEGNHLLYVQLGYDAKTLDLVLSRDLLHEQIKVTMRKVA